MRALLLIALALPLLSFAQQGPYAPAAEQTGSTAIKNNSYTIIDWAETCTVVRGYQDIADTALGLATVGSQSAGEGASDGSVVSLGDGGIATIVFNQPIQNTIGADIAIFENSFSDTFLELAHVEISSDGVNYFRFPSVSLTDTVIQVSSFGDIDPTNIYNLAGKYRATFGTPFDFQELDSTAGLNIDSISYVRIIDVVGSIDSAYATYDSQGNKINDPWPTAFASSGFDLDAVAALGDVTGVSEFQAPYFEFQIWPNPVTDVLFVSNEISAITIYDISGNLLKKVTLLNYSVSVSELNSGIYFIELISDTERTTKRFVKL
ncbi:MAG: T9SS type A sorting domain-containing protein [Flavobacteriales bacterium]|nr:T9SS type A sorting domain-containing protein [Flavobacteriales bacterium]